MGAVPFRAAYQPQPSASKMKFLILACLVLSAVAEPEPQHETVGFTKHLNGAVVPVDTTSVLQQKALHGAAHATAAVNGFKFPFYVRPAPVVKAADIAEEALVPAKVKPLSYTYPYTYGLQQPVEKVVTPVAYPYTTYGYPYTYTIPQAEHTVERKVVPTPLVKTVPQVYGHHLTYAGLPTVHHIGKREAEAEADPAVLYSHAYGTYGYPYAYTGYTGYPYTTHATYPYTYGGYYGRPYYG